MGYIEKTIKALVNNEHDGGKAQVVHILVPELVEVHIERFRVEVPCSNPLASDGVHYCVLVRHEGHDAGQLNTCPA